MGLVMALAFQPTAASARHFMARVECLLRAILELRS